VSGAVPHGTTPTCGTTAKRDTPEKRMVYTRAKGAEEASLPAPSALTRAARVVSPASAITSASAAWKSELVVAPPLTAFA